MTILLESRIQRDTWVKETPALNRVRANGSDAANAALSPRALRWQKIIDDIAAMQQLADDWDGQGAQRPTEELVRSAVGLGSLLQEIGVDAPSAVAPSATGSLLLVWQGPGESYCEIELTEPFHGEVMVLEPGRGPEHFVIPNA